MGRNWSPKYPVVCGSCGWKSKRTSYTLRNQCPKCRKYAVNKVEKPREEEKA